ncbi:MAG: DUF86 domain-containing protein [Chloroflexota bacterium]|nr:DUF86 domain-containing protein [Chloroflexota bacterium]
MRQPDEAVLLDMLMIARRIRDKAQSVTRAEFDADEDLQLALTHHIQIVGEAASRASEGLRAAYPDLPWPQIIGMRRRIVHDDLRVRAEVVWETATTDIPPLIQLLEPLLPDTPAEPA